MGTWYTYECKLCNYETHVSGRSDALFSGSTETMVCQTCKELADYVVKTENHELITTFTCEACGKHDVVVWNYKTKPCPKCAKGKMKKAKMGSITLAD